MKVWTSEVNRNGCGHEGPEDIDHQRESTGGPETYAQEVPRVYSPSTTLTVGMYAFRDLVPVVIEARHVHVVRRFLLLSMC